MKVVILAGGFGSRMTGSGVRNGSRDAAAWIRGRRSMAAGFVLLPDSGFSQV